MVSLDNFLKKLRDIPKASDIRLKWERKGGSIKAIVHSQRDMHPCEVPEELQGNWAAIIESLLPLHTGRIQPDVEIEDFCELPYTDVDGTERCMRFRASLSTNISGEELVLRILAEKIPSPEELLLPRKLVEHLRGLDEGLVLFVGQTGSGKTTSMASIVKDRAEKKDQAVVTLEDPVEYIYPSKVGRSEITMRQVGLNTKTFFSGLKAAMRMKPDVIVVGEIRDRNSAATSISAGMSGHLVIGSLHATHAFQGPQRLYSWIDNEESGMGGSIGLEVISTTLKAVIAQRLIKNRDDNSIVAIHEILIVTDAVSQLIANGDFKSLKLQIETGLKEGMQTFDQAVRKRIEERRLPPTATAR